jgi:hypothetical protein
MADGPAEQGRIAAMQQAAISAMDMFQDTKVCGIHTILIAHNTHQKKSAVTPAKVEG